MCSVVRRCIPKAHTTVAVLKGAAVSDPVWPPANDGHAD
jgi:hypothetical protein